MTGASPRVWLLHSVRHLEDGSVEVKGEPIPGGPTDPDAPPMPGEEKKGDAVAENSDD